MASVIFFLSTAAEATALAAATATGARSISLLESVVIGIVLLSMLRWIGPGGLCSTATLGCAGFANTDNAQPAITPTKPHSQEWLCYLCLRHWRPDSERAVRSVGRVHQFWNYRVPVQAQWRIRHRGRVVAIEPFLGSKLVDDSMLGPAGHRVQFAHADAGRRRAHLGQALQHVSGVHFFFIFQGAIETSDLDARGAQQPFLVGCECAALLPSGLGEKIHALAGAHRQHLLPFLRQRRVQDARNGIAENIGIGGAD